MTKKLSIIIPAYNEEHTIEKILNKVSSVKLIEDVSKEIIIINDASTDRTDERIKEYISSHSDMPIIYHIYEKNKGKGAALHKGIELASGDFIVIQDADLEYDPQDYNVLLKPILDNAADVVYGSRFIGGRPHRILFFWHSIGNKFLTFLSN